MKNRKTRARTTWLKVNEDRESKGLPRFSRRYFLRHTTITAAGMSLPFLGVDACGEPDKPIGTGASGGNGYTPEAVTGAGGTVNTYTAGTSSVAVGSTGEPIGRSADSSSVSAGGESGGAAGASPGVAGQNAAAGVSGEDIGPAGTEAGITRGDTGYDGPLVSMVRDIDWAKATRDAIEMIGGLPDLTGKSVMLRPNVISSQPAPTTTNPEVIRGAIQSVRAKGAAKIIVAEDGFATAPGLGAMSALGIVDICSEEGAEPMDLKTSQTVLSNPEGTIAWPMGINFYQAVLDADYVINMPVCKSHFLANYSMAIKAWFGNIPNAYRSHIGLANSLAELHLVKQENLVIVDASKAMVTGGPQTGTVAEPKIVVATNDPIAADITGLCIHKQFGTKNDAVFRTQVWEQPQIKRALALQFNGWLNRAQNYEYAQQGVEDHADIMAWRDQ